MLNLEVKLVDYNLKFCFAFFVYVLDSTREVERKTMSAVQQWC